MHHSLLSHLTGTRLALIACVLIGLCLMTGCISTERLAQAEAVAEQASERLADGEQAVDQARDALAQAHQLAKQVESQAAQAALAQARDALAQAQAALPALELAAQDTAQALKAARAAQEAGGSWWEMLLAGAAALATGGTAGAALMGTKAGKLLHALRGTMDYVDALKPAADASVGIDERKRLAAITMDHQARKVVDDERKAQKRRMAA